MPISLCIPNVLAWTVTIPSSVVEANMATPASVVACAGVRMPAVALAASQRLTTSRRESTALARLSGMPETEPQAAAISWAWVFGMGLGFDGLDMAVRGGRNLAGAGRVWVLRFRWRAPQ